MRYALLMTANKSETALYRAPTSSLLLVSHGGLVGDVCASCMSTDLRCKYALAHNLSQGGVLQIGDPSPIPDLWV